MRTHGTFASVYEAARDYYLGAAEDAQPSDAVVRRENGEWMLESRLEPAPDADIECDLEVFHDYFFEAYRDATYTPADGDVSEFVTAISD